MRPLCRGFPLPSCARSTAVFQHHCLPGPPWISCTIKHLLCRDFQAPSSTLSALVFVHHSPPSPPWSSRTTTRLLHCDFPALVLLQRIFISRHLGYCGRALPLPLIVSTGSVIVEIRHQDTFGVVAVLVCHQNDVNGWILKMTVC